MPFTRSKAKGIEPPKPLPKRQPKPKPNPRTFKEISADLTTANHAINAPTQGALPNNASDIDSTTTAPIPDAPTIIEGCKPRPGQRTVEVVIEHPKPCPLPKTEAGTARKADQDEDTEARNNQFSLFGRRGRYANSQETGEVHEQPPDTLYDQELEAPEYDFEDGTTVRYVEDDEDEVDLEEHEQRFGGYCPSSPDSVEPEYQRPHSVDSPVRRALLADSHAHPGSSHHSLTSLRGRSAERAGSRSRSPSAGPTRYQPCSHSAEPHSPSPSERRPSTAAPHVDAEFIPTHGCTPSRRSPLPRSSPPPVVESESDNSKDDYGKAEEDPKRGKAKAPVTNSYMQDDDDDRADGDHASGPVPTRIRQRVHDAYNKFIKEMDTIAKDCNKAPSMLHQLLGTSAIKTPRALSAWNVWQQYWAETHDKTQDAGSNPNATCRQALITACGIDEEFTVDMIHNTEAIYTRLPWLKEWHNKLVAQAVVNYREKNGLKKQLQQEMRPVIQTAHMIQKTYGIHVWGFVVDPRGDASYVFGAGDEFKEMRAAHSYSLTDQCKDQEHIFGNIELRKRGMAAQALQPHLPTGLPLSPHPPQNHSLRRASAAPPKPYLVTGIRCARPGAPSDLQLATFTHWITPVEERQRLKERSCDRRVCLEHREERRIEAADWQDAVTNAAILERITGWTNVLFMDFAPVLHEYYTQTLDDLFEWDSAQNQLKHLRRDFAASLSVFETSSKTTPEQRERRRQEGVKMYRVWNARTNVE
ncbi:hypothetical protein B0H13DRAFT_2338505 [Mycena leptocephala]|nr:hypothetical protein B0H13DRAFT_2338505 [Mycena leptocephala]